MNNNYFLLRHGEALSNQKMISSCWPEKFINPLTKKGKQEAREAGLKLKDKKVDPVRDYGNKNKTRRGQISNGVDLIFTSDLLRTKQTAEIVGKEIGIKPKPDKRLREYNTGIFNGGSLHKFREVFKKEQERWKKKPVKGETYTDITKRMYDFFQDIDKKYSNKNILIISHQLPLILLEGKVKGYSQKGILEKFPKGKRIQTGEVKQL